MCIKVCFKKMIKSKMLMCLEGMTGVGKTTIAKEFESKGYRVIYADELIFKLTRYDPVERQIRWILKWFELVRKELAKDISTKERPLIVDRSPYAGAMYWPNQRNKFAVDIVRELLTESKLSLFILCLTAPRKTILERIEKRSSEQQNTKDEEYSSRASLKEFDVKWFNTVLNRFNHDYKHIWHISRSVKDADHALEIFNFYQTPFSFFLNMERELHAFPQLIANFEDLQRNTDESIVDSVALHSLSKNYTDIIIPEVKFKEATWEMQVGKGKDTLFQRDLLTDDEEIKDC